MSKVPHIASTLNKGLEDNKAKHDVRLDMLSQIGHNVKTDRYSKLSVFTLPGEQCILENMLADKFNVADSKTLLDIHCAENDPRKIPTIQANLPSQASVESGEFDDVICKSIRTGNGVEYDAIWMDYFCSANPILIDRIAKYAQLCLKEDGIIYVTFYMRGDRHEGGGKHSLARLAKSGSVFAPLKGGSRNMTNRELKNCILKEIVKSFKRSNASMKKVYDVIYGGGRLGNTPMVTLGFSKGILVKDTPPIKVIQEDRIAKKINAKKRNKRKKGMRAKVVKLFEAGETNDYIKKACRISSPQLAGRRAWWNKQKRGIAWKKEDRV